MAGGQDESNQMVTPLFFIVIPLELSVSPVIVTSYDPWEVIGTPCLEKRF